MRKILIILLPLIAFGTVLTVASAPRTALAMQEGVAVVVNEDAITYSDVEDRLMLIMVSSGLPNTKDTRDKLRPQIVQALIDEQIRMQEARRLDISVAQEEIEGGIDTIAQQNELDPQEFRKRIQASGLKLSTMRDQIRAQIAWGKVVQASIRPQINVTDGDIDNFMERLQNNTGKSEYLVGEIFLPIDSANDENKSRNLARKLVQEIRGGQAPFFRVAQQFSKSAGAAQGGNLGWITQGQLDEELDAVLPLIQVGGISDPVRTSAGFHILNVREQRVLAAENLPSRDDVGSRIGLMRLERQAQRYLLDLKATSFIDNRLAL